MKFEVTDSFRADRRRLSEQERGLIADVLPTFVDACNRYADNPATAWPAALRVRHVEGAPGVLEVTFNFAGPDLRATFEWIQIEGQLAIRWRRIGGHRIFKKP